MPPLRLTPTIEHGLCDLLALGVPFERAAQELGLPRATAKHWLTLGHSPGAGPHWRRFAESVDAAKLEREFVVQQRLAELRRRL